MNFPEFKEIMLSLKTDAGMLTSSTVDPRYLPLLEKFISATTALLNLLDEQAIRALRDCDAKDASNINRPLDIISKHVVNALEQIQPLLAPTLFNGIYPESQLAIEVGRQIRTPC